MSVVAQALPGRNALRARLSLLDAAAFGPLRQAPGRTLLAVLAIALGVALGFAVYLINRVAADEVQGASRSLFGLADLTVQSPGTGFDESLFPRLLRVPGVAAASPVVEVQVRLPGRERNLKLLGIDPFRALQMQPALAGAGATTERQGQGLLAENSIWLSPAAAQSLELEVGDDLDVQVALDRVRFRVAGVLPPGAYAQPVGLLDIGEAQWRLRRLGRLDRVDLRLAPQADGQAVRVAIAALLPPGAQIVTPGEATDDAVRLTRAYRSNLTALALVALFTGAFLVYATQSLAVARRRREIALLHAMGMSVREQLVAALLSGMIVGALGAALGVILGALVARAGLASFGADLGAGYFRGVAPALNVSAGEYLVFFLLGVGAALVATFGPAREAASVPAAAALKAGDEAPTGVAHARQDRTRLVRSRRSRARLAAARGHCAAGLRFDRLPPAGRGLPDAEYRVHRVRSPAHRRTRLAPGGGGPAPRHRASCDRQYCRRARQLQPDGRDGDHGVLVPHVARGMDAAHPAGGSLRACGFCRGRRLPGRECAAIHHVAARDCPCGLRKIPGRAVARRATAPDHHRAPDRRADGRPGDSDPTVGDRARAAGSHSGVGLRSRAGPARIRCRHGIRPAHRRHGSCAQPFAASGATTSVRAARSS